MRVVKLAPIAVAVALGFAPAAYANPQHAGIQVALRAHGLYLGPIDARVGPMTVAAIRAFQQKAGLPLTGLADARTRAALGPLGRPLFGERNLRGGFFGLDVSVLQYLLTKRGLYAGALDGYLGPETQAALRRYQARMRLAADGVAGPRTRAALVLQNDVPVRAKRVVATARTYVVRPGDSLTAIAQRHGTTVGALARANRLDPRRVLLEGIRIVVPAASGSSPASRSSVTDSIARWAAHYGVDVQLARALAWQESGFQSQVRSGVGAVGVMQVTPATWSFAEMFLIGRRIPRTTDGNVRVGVAYLGHLLREFHGNARLAVGAYYQGPAGVRRRGLFKETKHFVANVLALRGRV